MALAVDQSFHRSSVGALIVVLAILVCVALPVFFLVRRFRSGEEPVAGGSTGPQIFGRDKTDWGPKPTARREKPGPDA